MNVDGEQVIILKGLREKVGIEQQLVGGNASFLREIEKIPVIAI